MEEAKLDFLQEKAKNIRCNILKMITEAGSGHPGGSLSSVEILTALYFSELNIDPSNPTMEGRDRFFLSKGHVAPALYATLAERGYFPQESLLTLRKYQSSLQGHPDMRKVVGIESSSGSLGQGLSVACGCALAAKLDNAEYRIFALLGDGELDEGQIWEAAMSASHYKLNNLCAFVDVNGLQIDGATDDVLCLGDLRAKWDAFGWRVIEVDGHNITEILSAIAQMGGSCPTVILAHTIKGKGVSFMEGQAGWHGKAPSVEQLTQALAELME